MKAMILCAIMAGLFFSCDEGAVNAVPKDSANDQYPAPKNIAASVSGSNIELTWEAAEKATGYAVLYGSSAAYEFTAETEETRLVIPGLDVNKTWYFAVRAKYGSAQSALNSIAIKGGVMISGGDGKGGEHPEGDDAKPGPFNFEEFAAQKAAWEAQGFRNYQFTIEVMYDDGGICIESTIASGKDPEITVLKADDPAGANFISQPFRTIDDIYNYIAADSTHDFFEFVLQYNKQYHYPQYYSAVTPGADGGWSFFEITSFMLMDGE
ncbi:MAG: fibronectin type III domain-containing protein [Spirochaetaceae bacterium]|nr:fibronectin type III domain-containing protein [Spirochaetaceae bacterium]